MTHERELELLSMSAAAIAIQHDEVAAAIALLAETFPKCFLVFEQRRRPLKVGIDRDILERLGEAMTPAELFGALRFYTGNQIYLRHLLNGAWRIDLDGNVVGVVTAKDEAHARRKIDAIKAKAAARKPAEEPKRDGMAELRLAAERRKAEVAAIDAS
jgi:sRNA-binding protein